MKKIIAGLILVTLIGFVMSFAIHETVHIFQLQNKADIQEVCFFGVREEGIAGWVLSQPYEEIGSLEVNKMENEAETISAFGTFIIMVAIIYLWVVPDGDKQERENEMGEPKDIQAS